jgi:hypothetical protein
MLRPRHLCGVRWGGGIGLFCSREIGPWREALINRHGRGRYYQSRHSNTEQYSGAPYWFDEHHRSPLLLDVVILRQYEFVCFFVPSALCLFLPRLFGRQSRSALVGLAEIGLAQPMAFPETIFRWTIRFFAAGLASAVFVSVLDSTKEKPRRSAQHRGGYSHKSNTPWWARSGDNPMAQAYPGNRQIYRQLTAPYGPKTDRRTAIAPVMSHNVQRAR